MASTGFKPAINKLPTQLAYLLLALTVVGGIIAVAVVAADAGDATREVFWNVVSWARWVAYGGSVVLLVILAYGPYQRYRLWRLGKPENRGGNWWQRARIFLVYGIGQGRLPNDAYASIMHLLIFWGWVVLFIGTVLLAIHDDLIEFLHGPEYLAYSVILDIFGVLALVGLGMALYRRYLMRPAKLRLGSLWDDEVLLFLMVAIVLTGFLVEGMRIGADELVNNPNWSPWSPVGWAVAQVFRSAGASEDLMRDIHKGLWWFHMPLAFAWIAWVGYGKLSHILLGSANIFMRKLNPTGARLAGSVLTPITDFETAEVFGAGRLQDFTWKQLADTDICVRCGRCEANCPATLTGKDLTPMGFLQSIKAYMHEVGPRMLAAKKNGKGSQAAMAERLIAGDVVSDNVIWDCLTCGACEEQCPIFIEHIQKLQDMRRYLVMNEARMPDTAQATLMQLEQRGHPWRGTQLTRTSWMEGMDVPLFDGTQEYLYWVGCSGALVERNVEITKAVVRLLQEAGVSFAVLGAEEGCSGDPARRMGNEYLFQLQAQQNIATFQAKGVRKIVANCPHCFNIMKNEYPQLGGNFEVIHHTELFARLVAQGKLRPRQGLAERIAIHDSCYIARHNGIVNAPREVLGNIPGAELAEMSYRGRNTFCCGAGGGHMWVEETKGRRVNHERTRQAAETGAQIVATSCPFCMQMFEDGVRAVPQAAERGMRVFDVAELLEVSVVPTPVAQQTNPTDSPAS